MKDKKSENQINSFISKILSKKCKLASALTVMFVFSIATAYAAPRQSFVRIVDGEYEVSGYSDGTTVGDLIDEHGIDVTKYDVVYPSVDTQLANGMLVMIDRPKRVNLTCDGYTVSYWTDADSFSEFVEMHSIAFSDEDVANVDLNAKLDFDNDISITRVKTVVEEIREEIPFETKYVNDSTLAKGKSVVRTEGSNGSKVVEVKSVSHDGYEISREIISERIESEPVDKVVALGTKEAAVNKSLSSSASAAVQSGSNTITVNGQAYSYSRVITCSATAYDLSFESTGKRPGDPYYGITASGTYAKKGTVAVDPSVIPLGTKMYIMTPDGSIVYGLCTAEDTGGAIKGNKVDLFYNTSAECRQFGRRNVLVYILK